MAAVARDRSWPRLPINPRGTTKSGNASMSNILVLCYSAYGHIEKMAEAVAEGARAVPGTQVTIKRVPELVPEEVAKTSGMKLNQRAPVAKPEELADYDAVIFGTPTRFGNMCAQMRNFLDQTGSLWMQGALVGKVTTARASRAPTNSTAPTIRASTSRRLRRSLPTVI